MDIPVVQARRVTAPPVPAAALAAGSALAAPAPAAQVQVLPAARPALPHTPPEAAEKGFSARLTGATLFDLIQFECLERSQRIVQVSDGARSGLLYFRAGNLVHAVEDREVGEAAVRRMLNWARGVFETCEGTWPKDESITMPWQNLLMRATEQQDREARRTKLLSFPVKESRMDNRTEGSGSEANRQPGTQAGTQPGSTESPRSTSSRPVSAAPAPRPGTTEGARDGNGDGKEEGEVTKRTSVPGLGGETQPITIRLAHDGAITSGQAPDEFVETVSYAAQMGDLLGELLGIDGFVSMEFALSNGSCVINRARNGDLLAARAGRTTEVATLRHNLAVEESR